MISVCQANHQSVGRLWIAGIIAVVVLLGIGEYYAAVGGVAFSVKNADVTGPRGVVLASVLAVELLSICQAERSSRPLWQVCISTVMLSLLHAASIIIANAKNNRYFSHDREGHDMAARLRPCRL